jgi:hypothetical protein
MCNPIISFFLVTLYLSVVLCTNTDPYATNAATATLTSDLIGSPHYGSYADLATPSKEADDEFATMHQSRLIHTPQKKVTIAGKVAMCIAAGITAVILIFVSIQQEPEPSGPSKNPTSNIDLILRSGNVGGVIPALPKDANKYKTQMCKNYDPRNPQSCKFGARCIFAHSPAELRREPKRQSFSFCKDNNELRVEARFVSPRKRQGENMLPEAVQIHKQCSNVAQGPDGTIGFAIAHAQGRRALLGLRSLREE